VCSSDLTLLCEAGLQAHRLGRLDAALEHLDRGVARAGPPSTKAACLYNLGRVLEDRGDPGGAEDCYADSLALRPNATVSERLEALRASADEDGEGAGDESDEGWDLDDGVALGLHALERAEPFPSIAEMCRAVGGGCYGDDERFAPERPSATLRELFVVDIDSREDMALVGFLVVHSDRGFHVAGRVTWTDSTDSYGRLEAVERVTEVRFEGDAVIVETAGHYDEPAGEAEAYWRCESDHPDDDAAREACFDEARTELGEPEQWTGTIRFVQRNGRWVAESSE
jgi:tetratricopeptide (TPR) repeat protein